MGSVAVVQHFAPVNPDLHADAAVGGLRFGKAVVDVRADGLQRDGAVVVLFPSGDFRAAQAAGDLRLDSLGAHPHGAADALLHGPAERNPLLELLGDVLRDELRVQVGVLDLDDVDGHGLVQELFAREAQLLDFGAALADHDARLRAVDVDAHFRGVALNLYLRDAGRGKPLEKHLAQLVVLDERVAELAVFHKPAGVPIFDDPHAETVRVDFLAHNKPPLLLYSISLSTMVTCDVRFRMRNARPCALGRMRLRVGPGHTKHCAT